MNNLIKLNSILEIKLICKIIQCQNKKRIFEIISEIAAEQLNLIPQNILNALLEREQIGNTGIGNGVALPHGKLKERILQAIGILIHLKQAIAFDASDNQPVDLIFTLFIPSKKCKFYLKTLSLIIYKLTDESICKSLRNANNTEELFEIIKKTNFFYKNILLK